MKKYFAKYLPVEGEIQDGDIVDWTGNGLYCKVFRGKKSNSITKYHEDRFYTSGASVSRHRDELKKHKLFLCSKDIKVGDKFKDKNFKEFECSNILMGSGTHYFPKEMLVWNIEDNINYWRPLTECYKVIGEISPEATWVKDGDEFDEDEIDIIYYDEEQNSEEIKFIKIKGPCGDFH